MLYIYPNLSIMFAVFCEVHFDSNINKGGNINTCIDPVSMSFYQ